MQILPILRFKEGCLSSTLGRIQCGLWQQIQGTPWPSRTWAPSSAKKEKETACELSTILSAPLFEIDPQDPQTMYVLEMEALKELCEQAKNGLREIAVREIRARDLIGCAAYSVQLRKPMQAYRGT